MTRLSRLPEYLDAFGVNYVLIDNWQTRSRNSGDFVDVMGVGIHHTATVCSAVRDLQIMYDQSADRPVGNGLLDRTGLFHLGAVRATNTQGKGGPYLTNRGVIPLDSANTRLFSIEAANNGVGEPWTDAMCDAYPRICAAVIACANSAQPSGARIGPGDVIAHFEWSPGRKIDPAGASPWASGSHMWDMTAFRRDVYLTLNPPPPPDPPPGGNMATAATCRYDGTDRYFVKGSDGHLYQMWWDATANAWSGWQNLDGVLVDDPCVLVNGARIDVTAEGGDGALWRLTWNGTTWEPWARIAALP